MALMTNPILRAAAAALISFAAIGTVTALWPNPLFVRMTPVQGFEVWLLVLQSVLIGLYVGLRRTQCSVRKVGIGSVIAFLGIACPTCNKLLLFLFGAGVLLEYFEPMRLYVALAGVLLTAIALAGEYRAGRHAACLASAHDLPSGLPGKPRPRVVPRGFGADR